VRYVEFSPKADRARTELPASVRLVISRAIRTIVDDPRLGAPGQDGPRFVAPADSPNHGAIAEIVRAGQRHIAITYRIRSADDLVWIEDIREVFVG
jgi:hypothetical protein